MQARRSAHHWRVFSDFAEARLRLAFTELLQEALTNVIKTRRCRGGS
jgi:hypothetical protein